MELALLALMVAAAVAMLAASSRARRARIEEATAAVVDRLKAHRGRSRWSESTAFLDHQDMVCGVYYSHGAAGEITGVFIKLEHDEVPEAGSVRVFKRGRASLDDYADRKEGTGTGDSDFDVRFRVDCAEPDRGFAYRLLDGEGRKLVREVARRQGEPGDPVMEYLAEDRLVRVWSEGHVTSELELDPLIELAARLARRITGKPRPEEKPPAASESAIEV